MTPNEIATIALFIFCFGLISRALERTWVSGPMVWVGFGLLAGPRALGVLELDLDSKQIVVLAEVTLGLLLFSDAIRIDLSRLRADIALPGRLLGVGLPMTIGLGAGLAYLMFDVTVGVALLIGAILAPTDAALGQGVVASPSLPERVRQTLNIESGLNDGIALPAVAVFLAVAGAQSDNASAGEWVRFAAEQVGYGIGVGVATGAVGGWLLTLASARGWVDGVFRQLAVLGVAATAVASATEVGGNGFIAAFVAGVAFGTVARGQCPHVHEFVEDLGQLLAMVTFVVFGAVLLGPSLGGLTIAMAGYAALSLTAVRMLPVAAALLGSGVRRPTVAFIGWFGPRGLASILFGLLVVETEAVEQADQLFTVVAWTVLASVVLHGLSAKPLSRAYEGWFNNMDSEESPMPEAAAVSHNHRIRKSHGAAADDETLPSTRPET